MVSQVKSFNITAASEVQFIDLAVLVTVITENSSLAGNMKKNPE